MSPEHVLNIGKAKKAITKAIKLRFVSFHLKFCSKIITQCREDGKAWKSNTNANISTVTKLCQQTISVLMY